ncbi:MAG: hypothetical protein OEV64_08750 [Desulfobulbaceae bacterium]|nr:hypothetical protein [Desulfobulbaceae bacterium]
MKLKCGRCGIVHAVNERNIPEKGVRMVRCDGCDNHFLVSNDCSVKAKYETSRRICPNCAKEVPVEAMQCLFCEYFFSKEDRFKNKRLRQRQSESFSPSDRRRKWRRLIVVMLLIALSGLVYYGVENRKTPVGRLLRFIARSSGMTTTIAEPSYMLKLASGGRMYVVSCRETGELLEVEDQRGSVFTIVRKDVVEIVPLP